MYLWNNIFFSTGFDGRGHFKDFGGEEAGHNAAVSYNVYTVRVDTDCMICYRIMISRVLVF